MLQSPGHGRGYIVAPVEASPDIVYVGRSRLHRSRANLVQTLRTVDALEEIGVRTRLWLPPWPRLLDVRELVRGFGIERGLDICRATSLHPRFGFWPFIRLHRGELRRAKAVYTRAPEIGAALANAGVPHHLEVHEWKKLEERDRLPRLIAAHREGLVRTLLPISRGLAERLTAAGAEASRVVVAPSGVDLAMFAAVPAFEPSGLHKPRVVCLGRMNRVRGLDVFRAAARAGCEVTLVGDQVEDVRRDASLTVHPFVPPREVPAWYGKCDLALIPYQPDLPTAESMSPIKLFEAMAAGRPIIASDLPTIREVIEHERNGLLVPAADLGAWTGAIDRLRRDPGLAARLAEAARVDARRYAWRSRAETIAAALGIMR